MRSTNQQAFRGSMRWCRGLRWGVCNIVVRRCDPTSRAGLRASGCKEYVDWNRGSDHALHCKGSAGGGANFLRSFASGGGAPRGFAMGVEGY